MVKQSVLVLEIFHGNKTVLHQRGMYAAIYIFLDMKNLSPEITQYKRKGKGSF